MKNSLSLLLWLPLVLFFTSCRQVTGSGPVVFSPRSLKGFNAVVSTTSADALITIGPVYSVRVEAQENLAGMFETVLEEDKLIIKTRDGVSISSSQPVNIHITMPELRSLELTGSGDARILNALNGESLHLDLSGSGNVTTAALALTTFEATVTGSGSITAGAGSCRDQRISLTGNGDINCDKLVAGSSHADLSGSGNIGIQVTAHLNAILTGSGEINYKGKPQVSAQVTGSGGLHQIF